MKSALSLVALAFCWLAPVLQAQDSSPSAEPVQEETPDVPSDPQTLAQEYNAKFQEGIDALTAGEHDKGIAAFKRCVELVPNESTCAYNIACGYSLKGELEPGFEWLGKAAKWGFGDTDGNIEHAGTDTDLANLRADERFAGILQSMKERNKAIEDYWKTPLIHIPESLKDVGRVPVLVVLHDMGETKQAVMDSGWKTLSDEKLGLALVVPGGMKPAGPDLTEGALWFNSLDEYLKRYWTFERPITQGLDALKKAGKKLERGQVYMVGVGQGGFVGMTAAVRAPSLYKGMICFDSAMALQVVGKKAPKAGEDGFRAAVYVSDTMFGVPPEDIDRACRMMSPALSDWKIGDAIQRMERTENLQKDRVAVVKKTINEWRQPEPEETQPVEAGSTK